MPRLVARRVAIEGPLADPLRAGSALRSDAGPGPALDPLGVNRAGVESVWIY